VKILFVVLRPGRNPLSMSTSLGLIIFAGQEDAMFEKE